MLVFFARIIKCTVFSIVMMGALMSCAMSTPALWERSGYRDVITHFLVSSDDQTLVFIGYDYHYVMKATPVLSGMLKWKYRKLLSVWFDKDFTLTSDNKITGEYVIACSCESASIPQKKWLIDNGFVYFADTGVSYGRPGLAFVYSGKTDGIRYATNDLNFSSYPSLNREYQLSVKNAYSAGDIVKRILLTPIAIMNDGVAIFGTAGLVLAATPIYLADEVSNSTE